MACWEHPCITWGRCWYQRVLRTHGMVQGRGRVVPWRQHVAPWSQGIVVQGKGAFQHLLPILHSSAWWLGCTGDRSGGDVVGYILVHTCLLLWKFPPICPANLPRASRRWHCPLWERWGGGEARWVILRSLRSQCFLFLLLPLMSSLQNPNKILSRPSYWEGRLLNTGKDSKEKKLIAYTSNEANIPSDFVPCLSGKKMDPL